MTHRAGTSNEINASFSSSIEEMIQREDTVCDHVATISLEKPPFCIEGHTCKTHSFDLLEYI